MEGAVESEATPTASASALMPARESQGAEAEGALATRERTRFTSEVHGGVRVGEGMGGIKARGARRVRSRQIGGRKNDLGMRPLGAAAGAVVDGVQRSRAQAGGASWRRN